MTGGERSFLADEGLRCGELCYTPRGTYHSKRLFDRLLGGCNFNFRDRPPYLFRLTFGAEQTPYAPPFPPNECACLHLSRLRHKRASRDVQRLTSLGGIIEGRFATAEEAAAVERAAKEAPLTSEEARQQAQAEGLKLQSAANHTGYAHVSRKLCRELAVSGRLKPYQAWVRRSGESVHLGDFATAEEAALSVARSQAAARDQALQQAQA